MTIFFFPNGNTAVCDSRGNQVPELQKSWFLLWLAFLEANSIDPESCEFTMPDGSKAKVFAVNQDAARDTWGWELIDANPAYNWKIERE